MLKKIFSAALLSCTIFSNAQTDSTKSVQLQQTTLYGIRVTPNTPVTQFNLNSKQINTLYYGADLPMVLQRAPGIHAYSDNGTGIGYSFFNMRGIDQTRINVTVNGVPLNDPQNQGVFFNNFADLASSAHSIQVQRGVGSSTNGTAAFGGSINILTQPVNNEFSAELHAGYGSFNSRRLTAQVQTGTFAKNWGAYLRLSNLATDGYRQNSGSEITSYMFSVARQTEKTLLRINAWGGDAQSKLAYMGADANQLAINRRFNPLQQGERDRFKQNFYQVQYNYVINKRQSISSSVYAVTGNAPYFQFHFPAIWGTPYGFFNLPEPIVGNDTLKVAEAMTAYRLNQFFYGGFVNYNHTFSNFNFIAGLHANSFTSEHFLEVKNMQVWPAGYSAPHRVYFNTGTKQEFSAFAKGTYHINASLNIYADMQIRTARFSYKPQVMAIAQNAFNVEDMQWLFFNPKAGINFNINRFTSLYAMFAISGREPTRLDYFRDDLANRDIKQNEVKPEFVRNVELGYRYQSQHLNLQVNGYVMQFSDAIINTGATNNFGAPITTNVPDVLRTGIELDVNWKISDKFSITHASNISRNRIKEITHFYTDFSGTDPVNVGINFKNTQPALTPAVIVNQGVRYTPFDMVYADVNFRYVAEQFTDNSNINAAKIPGYYVADLRLALQLKKWLRKDVNLSFLVNNILNNLYSMWGNNALFSNIATPDANGTFTPTVTPLFFVAPPRNYFITLHVKF